MLIAMADSPNGEQEIKLANNMSYLGDTYTPGAGQPPFKTPTNTSAQSSALDQAQGWANVFNPFFQAAAPIVQTLVAPKLNCKKTPQDPRCQAGGGQKPEGGGGEERHQTQPMMDWSSYAVIGGGVILTGIALYAIFKKPSKKR